MSVGGLCGADVVPTKQCNELRTTADEESNRVDVISWGELVENLIKRLVDI